MQPLRDPVDEEVGDHELAQIAGGEGFVLLPEPLGDLTHRRPAQETLAVAVPEGGFDVSRTQAAGEQFDRQALELGGPTRQARADPRREGFGAIRDLGHAVLDGAFGGAQPAPPVTVPIPASGLGPAFVVGSARTSLTSASRASSTICRTASLNSSDRASPSATPSFSNASSRWCVCSDAGILEPIGDAPLAAGANRRLGCSIPSKSASPIRFPARVGLHRSGWSSRVCQL